MKDDADNDDNFEEEDSDMKRIRSEDVDNYDKLLLKEDFQANVSDSFLKVAIRCYNPSTEILNKRKFWAGIWEILHEKYK